MPLLISQQDDIYSIIQTMEFSPSQFKFLEVSSLINIMGRASNLKYLNSPYYYLFDLDNSNQHYAKMCPGTETLEKDVFARTWDFQIEYFVQWLQNLKREVTAPNYWARLNDEIKNLDFQFESSNEKFTFQEFQDVVVRMEILRNKLSSIPLAENQFQALNQKLDFLTDSAKDMSKFDWKSLFIGIVVNIIMQLSVTPDNARLLWALIKEVFNSHFLN